MAAPIPAEATPAPPAAAITPMKANCDPPLNIRRLNTWVCHTSKPAVTDKAPKEIPYRPVAMPTPIDIDVTDEGLVISSIHFR
jgi:hypothetical protein